MTLLNNVISKLDGLRTLIVYDSPLAVRAILLGHILPYYSNKNVYIIIYSESMCRRAKKSYESFIKICSEKAKMLDKINIIKIGFNKDVPFGNLYEFINLNESWYDRLSNIIKDFDKKDIIIFHGFSLVQLMYRKDWIIKELKFFDSIPSDTTIINKISNNFYRDWIEGVMKKLHDVVIRVEKSETSLLDHEESYLIGVEESIVADLPTFCSRFKLSEDGVFEEC
jgi:hypothetical protein